jgi:hypothetical protein
MMDWQDFDRILQALRYELGERVLLRFQTRPRDLRWFRGLFR